MQYKNAGCCSPQMCLQPEYMNIKLLFDLMEGKSRSHTHFKDEVIEYVSFISIKNAW
jgi:hypothetical protein